MKSEWRAYIERLPFAVTFHHRDDFAAAWPDARFALPAILIERSGRLQELVTAAELDEVPDVTALMALLDERLAQLQRV